MIFWLGKKAGGSFFRRRETLVLISFPLKEIHFRDDGGRIDMLKKLLLVGLVFWKRKERWKECIGTLRLCAKNWIKHIMHLPEMALLMSQQPDNDEELKAMRMKRKTIYKLVLLFM